MSVEAIDRPLPISIFCSLLLALGLFNIVYTFTGIYAPYGLLYSAAHTLLTIIMFAAISGIWSMEKWGVYLFLGIVALKFGLDVYTGAFHYMELLLLLPALYFLFLVGKMK
jgi:hypothetical protein